MLTVPQVLRGGDWTESLTSALLKLGCCLLDCQLLDFPCPALAPFVQQPTAAGVLDALIAAQSAAAASTVVSNRALQGTSSSSSRGLQGLLSAQLKGAWQQQLQDLTAAERNQLRTYLLQAKWFAAEAALTQQQLHMLRALPIYEVHAPLQYELHAAASSQQQQPGMAAAASRYVPLIQAGRQQLLLPPSGVSNQVLGSRFLQSASDTEDEILVKHLGVLRLSMSQFLAQHLATQPELLDQRALVSTLVYVLANVRQLAAKGDPDLPSVIR